MLKQLFKKDGIITIAEYIYNNEFEAHFNEKNPSGMGNGKVM